MCLGRLGTCGECHAQGQAACPCSSSHVGGRHWRMSKPDTHCAPPPASDPKRGTGSTSAAAMPVTIEAVPADTVVIATPIDLTRLVHISKPTVIVSGMVTSSVGQAATN